MLMRKGYPYKESESMVIKVKFAMAYGETQNFGQPIYSGIFVYRVTFSAA